MKQPEKKKRLITPAQIHKLQKETKSFEKAFKELTPFLPKTMYNEINTTGKWQNTTHSYEE